MPVPLGVSRLAWQPQGLLSAPSPLREYSDFFGEVSTIPLWVKEDSKIPALGGGSKARKLDYLLPTMPKNRPWTTVGSIGSGHLLACAKAAQDCGVDFHPHTFPQTISRQVLHCFAETFQRATSLKYYTSRASLAIAKPGLFIPSLQSLGRQFVIPPGGSNLIGTIAFVAAGIELAEQIRSANLDSRNLKIYIPLGSGGSAVGLAVGLSLSELPFEVQAIATVEPALSTRNRLKGIFSQVRKALRPYGLEVQSAAWDAIAFERSYVGSGYGRPSARSLAACAMAARHDLQLEPIYTGKAMAALLAHRKQGRHHNSRVILWQSCARPCSPAGLPRDTPAELLKILRQTTAIHRGT